MRIFHLFISHSWSYSDAYDKLVKLLDNRPYFNYKNYSVPKDDPIHCNGTDKELCEKINLQMKTCHCILILAGVYCSYSKWIDKEIDIANSFSKPIIGIKPRENVNVSTIVQNNAIEIVNWNTNSIIDAIKKHSI